MGGSATSIRPFRPVWLDGFSDGFKEFMGDKPDKEEEEGLPEVEVDWEALEELARKRGSTLADLWFDNPKEEG